MYCGVQCLVFDETGDQLLLGRRYRTSSEGQWALPGGHVEEWETPIETARRELHEETGVTGLDAELLPSFLTWHTERPYAHFPVLFESVFGEPQLQDGERFSELGFYPVKDLPSPMFEPSQIAINSVRTAADKALLRSAEAFVRLDMVSLRQHRLNAAWTIRAFVGTQFTELVVTWGPRSANTRSMRRERFSSKNEAIQRFRLLVLRRVRHQYQVVGLSGDLGPDHLSAWLPELHLSVVSSELLARLADEDDARQAFKQVSPRGLRFEDHVDGRPSKEPAAGSDDSREQDALF